MCTIYVAIKMSTILAGITISEGLNLSILKAFGVVKMVLKMQEIFLSD